MEGNKKKKSDLVAHSPESITAWGVIDDFENNQRPEDILRKSIL
jgi:hypothetical protein